MTRRRNGQGLAAAIPLRESSRSMDAAPTVLGCDLSGRRHVQYMHFQPCKYRYAPTVGALHRAVEVHWNPTFPRRLRATCPIERHRARDCSTSIEELGEGAAHLRCCQRIWRLRSWLDEQLMDGARMRRPASAGFGAFLLRAHQTGPTSVGHGFFFSLPFFGPVP